MQNGKCESSHIANPHAARNGSIPTIEGAAMSCDCTYENKKVYYAVPHLFSDPGPSGSGMTLGEVEVTVCRRCAEVSFKMPPDKRRWFGVQDDPKIPHECMM